ncbi:MAG: hypothetical protein WKI04_02540 [Ferruginibacter sp.]
MKIQGLFACCLLSICIHTQGQAVKSTYPSKWSHVSTTTPEILLSGIPALVLFRKISCIDFMTKVCGQGKSLSPEKTTYTSSSKRALTGLLLIRSSMPLFLKLIQNKKITGLKLACQKTSFGAGNKALRKVTGLTFSLSL